ncbi:hypothetical protein B0H12DRAFT_485050 [Mycena haematopus]|nr:hypothetical protein B0H12DRAFT_485050 [Mycena haematopus]
MLAIFNIWAILVFTAPFASALDIVSIIGNFVSGGSITMTWTASASDATSFSVELFHQSFEDTYAIATNVNTSTLNKTMTIPEVPVSDGFYIQLVDIFNVNNVFSTSKSFSVGADNTTASLTVKESAVPTPKSSAGSAGSATQTDVPISTKPAPSTTPNAGAATESVPASSAPSSAAPSTTGTSAALATRSVFSGSFFGALLAPGVIVGAFAL